MDLQAGLSGAAQQEPASMNVYFKRFVYICYLFYFIS